jgi:hypothetical protein
MAKQFQRHDFVIKDLVISIAGGRSGGTWMPGPDDETPPTPISPIASVLAHTPAIESIRATILEALASGKEAESIGQAFIGDAGGHPAIRLAIHNIGAAVVASAAYAALGGSPAGLPNPECGGTSLETIPTPITPIVVVGREVHRVTELPRLRQQLATTIAYMDKAATRLAPHGAEVAAVRGQLEAALKNLG